MPIYALGGDHMREAGAELIEASTEDAVMLAGSIRKILDHKARLRRLRAWLADHPLAAHVPVDSPAANWSICELLREVQPRAKIVHLVAPQVWAWATWRVQKLRRLTNHVLCLLPFEPEWLTERGIPCTFVGHPLMDVPPIPEALFDEPRSSIRRVALLPGSRMAEIQRNWPTMLEVFLRLRREHPQLKGEVAAVHHRAAAMVRRIAQRAVPMRVWSKSIQIRVGEAEHILRWADVVMVVSGTATLQVAAHRKPMVVLYNVGWLSWNLFGRWLVETRTFSLPNLIGRLEDTEPIVPEFVPHFRGVEPIASVLERLLTDERARREQRERLSRVRGWFEGVSFAEAASNRLLEVVEKG